MPLQATSGAASYDAFGGGAAAVPAYIEDVFSTYLYTGTGATQTITNNIDLSGKGGLVWIKSRTSAFIHQLHDSARGLSGGFLRTTGTQAQFGSTYGVTAFNSNGFNIDGSIGSYGLDGGSFVSWTFRKQPKFFDIVTYTGDAANRTIAHNLGSVPACIIVKRTDDTSNWAVYHKDLGVDQGYVGKDFHIFLNLTNAQDGISDYWNRTAPTSTVFSIGANSAVNTNGGTYIAYLFAHDAGGFGLTGTDNVISCGSFTPGGGGSATVTLGWEPQWVLVKVTGTTGNWTVIDNMRDWSLGGNSSGTNDYLRANTSGAELEAGTGNPTATGFFIDGVVAASQPHIYIAIRRGPMKVPTVGTSVFNGIARTGNGTATTVSNSGFTPDMVMSAPRVDGPSYGLAFIFDRLRGPTFLLETRSTQATQTAATTLTGFDAMNGYIVGVDASGYGSINANAVTYINWNFKRAPSFFDEVCYSPPSSSVNTYSHNLGVIPELMIIKTRDSARRWVVYTQTTGNTQALHLNTSDAVNSTGNNYFNSTSPTASVFTLDNGFADVCNGGGLGVAYLFATCAGVSKVGSYTGTGTTLQIDCGFTAGARFVLIKRTDSTGDWYVWDSARGIVAGNDPYLLLNNLAAEVTSTDYIDTYNAGFEISSTAPSAINASGGTFIFLAIA